MKEKDMIQGVFQHLMSSFLKFHVKLFRYFQSNMIEILKLLLTLFKFSSILKPQKQFK